MSAAHFERSAAGGPDIFASEGHDAETTGHGAGVDPSTWPLLRVLPGTSSPGPGTSLGPYRLLRVLGRGGMGVVYLAHEAAPIQRLVAVKVLRSTSESGRLRQRLETEVRALARLGHPNIAQVFAAGHTADGWPYFALEYVPGLRIDEYCNRERLTLEERLQLFLQLCRGVRYAHARGVLHRDIKPSNVLVTEIEGRPLVKIIDFSIAASLVPSDADSATSGISGTPGYMSPEARRSEGSTADPRSDIYSLGVVLYLLLSGLRPFARETASGEPAAKTTNREVPPAPSERVGPLPLVARENLAEKRGLTKPSQLSKMLRGNLDAIILRAMDPVRSQRYGSVQELVADIERHFGVEPVQARPLTWPYRVSCFARRNRGRLVAAASVAAGLVLTLGLGAHLRLSTLRAEAELDAERQATALIDEILPGIEGPSGTASARPLLEEARRRVESTEEPIVQGRLLHLLGRAYHRRHDYETAADLLENALHIQEQTLGTDSVAATETAASLCMVYSDQARYARALGMCERSLAQRLARLGDRHPSVGESFGLLAYAAERTGAVSRAGQLHGRAVELRRELDAAAPGSLVAALEAQASFHRRQGDVEAAQRLLEEALQRHIDLHGSTDPAIALRREALADLYTEKGELENARIEYLHGLQILARAGRGHDVHRARLLERLARLDLLARRDQEAERHAVQAMDLLTRSLSPSHPTVAEAHVLLGRILVQSGNLDDAALHVDAALSIYGAEFGAHHPDTAMAELAAGDLAAAHGRLQPAREHYESALAPLRQFRPRAPETARALSRLGSALQRQGLPTEAQRLHQEALSILEGLTGPPQLEAAAVLRELARLARAGGDPGEAARFLERALMLRVALVGASDPEVSSLRAELDELERPAQTSTS